MKRLALIAAVSCFLLSAWALTAFASDLADVQAKIKQLNLGWTAGETSMSRLSPEEFAQYLNLAEMPAEAMSYVNDIEVPKDMPRHLDWRDIDGRNFSTPIKDQHPCGTCATFSAMGVFEAIIKITLDNDFIVPDLSEEHVYACEGPLPYTLFHPMIYLKGSGAPDETCFPYDCEGTGDRPPCTESCADWENRAFKSTDYQFLMWPSAEQIMAALQDGPIVAGFQVDEDFQYYTGGIYVPSGGPIGGHGVAVFGYDADEQYWICKNSWGEEWGEKGWFYYQWGEGPLRFGYQCADVQADRQSLCSANVEPDLTNVVLTNKGMLAEDEDLVLTFDWQDFNANLAGGELFWTIDDEEAQRFDEPLVELVGTSSVGKEPLEYLLSGPFGPGEHTLTVVVRDLCQAESQAASLTFQVAGEVPDDDDDAADDDATDDDATDDDATDDDAADDDATDDGQDDDDDDNDSSCG